MENEKPQPHDDFFKVAFSRQDVVSDYITTFLDAKIVKNIDLQSLTIANTSYITAEMEKYFADIVWECQYGTTKTPITVAFIFEHKSYVPKFPHLQLLRYMLEVWINCEKDKNPLKPLIPIIVYHSKRDRHWKYKPFSAYFKGIDEALLPYIPSFEYQLTDLTTFNPEQILAMQINIMYNALLTLQFGSKGEYTLKNIKTLILNVKDVAKDEHLHTYFFAQLVYVLKNNQFSPDKVNDIIQEFKNTVAMNAYDTLKKDLLNEGREEGREEGIEKGREEGIEKGREEGIEIGLEKGRKEVVSERDYKFTKSLIVSTDFDDSKIAILADVSVEYVQNIRVELSE